MRWLTFRDDSGERTGVLSGDGETIHLLTPGVSLLDLIGRGAAVLQELGNDALRSSSTVPLDRMALMAPIPRPPSIRDSLCFLDHMRNCQAAMGGGRVLKDTWYRIPAFYFACPSTVLGPYDDAPMAPGSVWQDFELEIAAVIGTAGKDLSVADAEKAIIGYKIFKDWSARDLQQLEGQLAIGQAKGKDSGVTLGPYLVTPDELEPYRRDGKLSLEVTGLVNGGVVGAGSTAAMDWSFGEVLSYASRGVALTPGDVSGPAPCRPARWSSTSTRPHRNRSAAGCTTATSSRSQCRGWVRPVKPSAKPPHRNQFRRGIIRMLFPRPSGSTRRLRKSRTPVGYTRLPTGCGPGCYRTADTAGATPASSPATARRYWSTRYSTWH